MNDISDAHSQGEYPDSVPDEATERPGDYTESEIPGDPEHVPANPGEGQFTDSELEGEPHASGRQSEEGQYTDSELEAEPDAADRDAAGEYTDADH